MKKEIRKKENCISQYNNSRVEEDHIKIINNPYKLKRAFIELRRGLCMSFDVCWCEQ